MEPIFNAYKMRYVDINRSMDVVMRNHNIRQIGIYIDLDSILQHLHNKEANRVLQVAGKNGARHIVSHIMNIAAHYRNWAIKERTSPIVVLHYTNAKKVFKNSMYVEKYRERYMDLFSESNSKFYFVNTLLQDIYPMLHLLAKYIPNVYVINSKYLEPSIIPLYLMQNRFKCDWNVVVSRDFYALQYAFEDKCTVIAPKANNRSTVIDNRNFWLYVNEKVKAFKDHSVQTFYDPQVYIYVLGLIGDKYRSIPNLNKTSWKEMFKLMNEAIDSEPSGLLELQLQRIKEYMTKKGVNMAYYENNINCIDIQRQVDTLLETDKAMIDNQIEDMIDYSALQRVNNEAFPDCPLNLDFLCKR